VLSPRIASPSNFSVLTPRAQAAGGDEGRYGPGKIVERREQTPVLDVLPGLRGKACMNFGRFAVRYRIADNGVDISHDASVV
jgi:hypothetical protein